MRVHTVDKPYSCLVCNTVINKSSPCKDYFQKHMRVHTGKKLYM